SISEKMVEALNRQINAEIYSAYLYLSMASYFDSIGLKGFSNWMRVQWQEELMHAMKMFDFVSRRGGRVKLYAVEEPPSEWDSPLAAFEHVYEHEVNVTKRIHELVEMAMQEKDFATYNFLQWYVAEQVEEEASALDIVEKLRLIGEDKRALLFLDKELSLRQ
uniref:Ferritin n=1 Tax=Archaeoglobus fulgidus TaxID=2234 RepID=UPI000B5DBA11|nr:Chain A, Ferritin [Archaeoglobus fulgidus]5V5K_B Chain B, Ferritin [Archaeoglobus fulgidus]5V5K_C Chain C, Ferritin [Archaeoglobus fulgidus]5V5K_D Chain D, Ferritin [Archaeoglobus fulgidus]5V5K_E Chain E, Ferritin [Archaeoglobus fulgidus]5V5K_F Chain F, Ferritin [Archaeoglobus fulgidus]5V5K_G Chain G, Ferritin [Archaeoglobus fulgidus]5V5K_H Chain H, Ferritin [Archaeoglobus fulgidus]